MEQENAPEGACLMYRKTTTQPIPENAIYVGDGKIKVLHKGKMIEREINASGKMIVYSSRYYAKVRQHDGKVKEIPLTTDKATSEQLMAQARRTEARIAAGLEDAPRPDADQSCIDLASEWLIFLESRERAPDYIETNRSRITRVIEQAPFPTPSAIEGPDASRRFNQFAMKLKTGDSIKLPAGETFTPSQLRHLLAISGSALAKLATNRGIVGSGQGRAKRYNREEAEALIQHRNNGFSPSTINSYRTVFLSFCNWLVKRCTIGKVPQLLARESTRKGQRKTRRAIAWTECELLAETTHKIGKKMSGMTPPARAMLYKVAFRTLLRARALRELTVADCHLAGPNPFLAVRAETDKTGRARAVPLPKDLANDLAAFIANRPQGATVWKLPAEIARIMRSDLRRAGIPYRTIDGVIDFHALRHSGATHMARAGVSLDIVAKVGGWTSLTQFFSRYGHYSIEHLSEAAAKSW